MSKFRYGMICDKCKSKYIAGASSESPEKAEERFWNNMKLHQRGRKCRSVIKYRRKEAQNGY